MNTALLLAASYVWTQILVPGHVVVSIFGLNDRGQTTIALDDGNTVGVYGHGVFKPLPPFPAGYSGPGVTGINNSGTVCGAIIGPDGFVHGFILRGSTYTFFSQPGWDNTEARAIGNSGLI